MSNHTGSYLLNEVLLSAKETGIFKAISQKKKVTFLKEVLRTGADYDCNPGEILENLGDDIGICYCCSEESKTLKEGLCPECYSEDDSY
jgi:hypothetical protein